MSQTDEKPVPAKKDQEPVVLEKHTFGSWLKSTALGFFIGLAVIVPGISGATVSIIFKLYDKIIGALSILFSKRFVKSFLWLLPLIVGGLIGLVIGYYGVDKALQYIPFAIVCLFGGLMIGAFPAVTDEIKAEKPTPWRIVLMVLGVALPILISALMAVFGKAEDNSSNAVIAALANVAWWKYIVFFLIGAVIGLTQIVPGLSASAFLMMVGYFSVLVAGIGTNEDTGRFYWLDNPSIIAVYAVLALGFLVGLLAFSKGLNWLLSHKRKTSFFLIVGLSAGSIVSIFYNPEIAAIYASWADPSLAGTHAQPMAVDLSLGIVLLLVGFAISFALYLYQKKRDKAEAVKKAK